MTIKIGDLNSEILERVEIYFKNLRGWGSLFVKDPTDDESIEEIISEYEDLNEKFVNFYEDALKNLNNFSNMLLWGRRGTGKSTYLTKSFFHQIYKFKGRKRNVPIFIDCNLLFKEDLEENLLNISYFYAGLKSQIVKSLLLFQKILHHFNKKNLVSLDEDDLSCIKFKGPEFETEDFSEDLARKNYDLFLEKYSQQLYNNIQKDQPMNFESILTFLIELKRQWQVHGFIFYIDEVSEFFIAKGHFKESVRNYFLDFISRAILNYSGLMVFKLVLYQEYDFEYLQRGAPKDVRVHRKYFNSFAALDLFNENKYFGKKIGIRGTSIKRQYEADLNKHIDAIFNKASNDWNRIIADFENNEIQNKIYKYLRESTGGTIRELGFIISEAIKQSKENKTRPINVTIPNLRAAIIAHYKKVNTLLLTKEIKLIEEVISTKKKDKDPNILYFTDRINTSDYKPLDEKNVEKVFKHNFLAELEQNFIINIVSMLKINGGTETVFVFHPGYAFQNTWPDKDIEFNSNHLRHNSMHIALNLRYKNAFSKYFKNYIEEIEVEEQSIKNKYLNIIKDALLKKGESLTSIERFIFPSLKNQSIYGLKLFCEEVGIELIVATDEEVPVEEVPDLPTPEDDEEKWFDAYLERARKKLIRTQYLKDYLKILEIINIREKATFEDIGNELNISYPVSRRKYFLNFLKKKSLIEELEDGIFQIKR